MNADDLISTVGRFWSHVDQSGDCWEWTGEHNSVGYGQFTLWPSRGVRERILAHRMSVVLTGRKLLDSQVVMHHCDNPPCVNPSHLSVGTQRENLLDARRKNRMNLDGLAATVVKRCKECGQQFEGASRRRYCDEHRFDKTEYLRRWRANRWQANIETVRQQQKDAAA